MTGLIDQPYKSNPTTRRGANRPPLKVGAKHPLLVESAQEKTCALEKNEKIFFPFTQALRIPDKIFFCTFFKKARKFFPIYR
ncbi:MAG: hypothetical protein JW806_00260, partial [Sedimentisphaerales bacterium]|nr:hypothetical protein [Sedimentisphaerales bacterium]